MIGIDTAYLDRLKANPLTQNNMLANQAQSKTTVTNPLNTTMPNNPITQNNMLANQTMPNTPTANNQNTTIPLSTNNAELITAPPPEPPKPPTPPPTKTLSNPIVGADVNIKKEIQGISNPTDLKTFLSDSNNLYQTMFGDYDFGGLSQASNDYIKGLLSGQTPASRALQAQEAAAMSQGIHNLMNNISATAAANGFQGGDLEGLYANGLQTIANTMGDFALKNIVNMEKNQAAGQAALLELYGANEAARSNMVSAITTYRNLTNSNDQWKAQYNLDVSDRMITLMQDSPALAAIYSKYLKGTPLTDSDIASVRQFTTDNWTYADAGNEQARWAELGIETTAHVRVDANGKPVLNSQGQQIIDVEPVIDVTTGLFKPIAKEEESGVEFSRTNYQNYPNANYQDWKEKYVLPYGIINEQDKDALLYFANNGNEEAQADYARLFPATTSATDTSSKTPSPETLERWKLLVQKPSGTK